MTLDSHYHLHFLHFIKLSHSPPNPVMLLLCTTLMNISPTFSCFSANRFQFSNLMTLIHSVWMPLIFIYSSHVIALTFRHNNMEEYFLVNLYQVLGFYFLMILLELVIYLCY